MGDRFIKFVRLKISPDFHAKCQPVIFCIRGHTRQNFARLGANGGCPTPTGWVSTFDQLDSSLIQFFLYRHFILCKL
jgi:hypothetical protein